MKIYVQFGDFQNLQEANYIFRLGFFCGLFVLLMSCVCLAFAPVHCCLVVTCWGRADLLALVCDVLFVILSLCHSPVWYPRSGAALDCIDS